MYLKCFSLVQVWHVVLGIAPGLSQFFHFVKVRAVGKGAKHSGSPRMSRGEERSEEKLFQLGEFSFDRANPIVEGRRYFCELFSRHAILLA